MSNRRPLTTRDAGWAKALAFRLAQAGVEPNFVSLLSVVCAAIAALAFLFASQKGPFTWLWYITAALMIQMRLLCNLLDGMIAIEHQRKSILGDIYNDVPDRIADIFILIGAGYSIQEVSWGAELGWAAACFAVLTAYVRLLGTSLGLQARFTGPMAKPHRMATMTVASVAAAVEHSFHGTVYMILIGLLVVTTGSIVTCIRRTVDVVSEMTERSGR